MISPQASPAIGFALAAVSGVALPLSFSPFEWWWMAPVSLAILYFAIQNLTPRQALLAGWLYGLGYYAFGVYWIYYSLHLFGAAIAPLAVALTAVFVLVMTVFPALVAWCFVRWRKHENGLRNTFLFASLWLMSELLRGKIMGGFPWILVGYSQTSTSLGGFAPILGVYGIGFILVWAAACSVVVVTATSIRSRVIAAIGIVLLLGASYPIEKLEWSLPKTDPLKLRLVQANIAQEMKFSQQRLQNALNLYTSMTLDGLDSANVDIVVWPETAIPTYYSRVAEVMEPFAQRMDAAGIDVLTGVFSREGDNVYNSVIQLGGDHALYKKRHLVPFGEFMPMRFLLDFAARFIDIPMSDLSAGAGPHAPLLLQGESIGVSICYEDVYGEEMRALLPASSVLVNVSNDAWFGDSVAPHQHEQKARMRAREFARPMIRVTNTGISSGIDEHGVVLGRIAYDTQGILDVTVTPRTGVTPYARTGNWPVFLLALLLLIIQGYDRRRNEIPQ